MKPVKIMICTLFFSFVLFQSPGFAFKSGHPYTLSGKTMGTFYTIKFISARKESLSVWKEKVDTRLTEVNKRLSMFDPGSELSLFNRQETGVPVTISSDFHAILVTGRQLYQLTQGAWDGTVKPLVDLWGFGTKKEAGHFPDMDEINTALSRTGFNHIDIRESRVISKARAVTLDLGSIAKGYGVDAIASLFISSGIHDLLVEIGGELYASGRNKKGRPWSVGISRPDKEYAHQDIYKIVRLENQAIATSGNYRNFFEKDGKTFSHIINPRTGFPADSNIVSASVIAKDCTFADGLATALMIMDVKQGLTLVNRLENTECLIIQKKGKTLVNHPSEKFKDFVVK